MLSSVLLAHTVDPVPGWRGSVRASRGDSCSPVWSILCVNIIDSDSDSIICMEFKFDLIRFDSIRFDSIRALYWMRSNGGMRNEGVNETLR